MYMIAGLGNPGKEYNNTRHNIGFAFIDALAQEYDINVMDVKLKALTGKGTGRRNAARAFFIIPHPPHWPWARDP